MKDDDDDDNKLTPADIQAIIDIAEYRRDLMNRLANAYRRKCDMKETITLLDELLGPEKESVH